LRGTYIGERLASRPAANRFCSNRMSATVPLELVRLLHTHDADDQARAWDVLITSRSRLLLSVARSFGGGHDEVMDRYALILEKLREDNYRRLRTFAPDRGASFETWLSVAARRVCLDHHRTLYGRSVATPHDDSEHAMRRALVDSLAGELDVDHLADESLTSVEVATARRERDQALAEAIETLTSTDKLLLALRFRDDLSASRIAGVLGVPTQFHVYRALNRVLSQLRTALEDRGIDGSDG
jgi:RNA polymerase sigma factor (sigma-70 family)